LATTNETLSGMTAKTVQAGSLDKGLKISWNDDKKNDLVFGYDISRTANE